MRPPSRPRVTARTRPRMRRPRPGTRGLTPRRGRCARAMWQSTRPPRVGARTRRTRVRGGRRRRRLNERPRSRRVG